MENPDNLLSSLERVRNTIADVIARNRLQISADTIRKGYIYSDMAIRNTVACIARDYYGISLDNSNRDHEQINRLILAQLVLQYMKPEDVPYFEDGSVNTYAFREYDYHQALRTAIQEAVIQAGLDTLNVSE